MNHVDAVFTIEDTLERVIVPKCRYDMLELMTKDFMDWEQVLNENGIETRNLKNDDEIRNMNDIISDIGKIIFSVGK